MTIADTYRTADLANRNQKTKQQNMKTGTKKKLRTDEVIDLWADLFYYVWDVVDTQVSHQRLRDGFANLMSRRDISKCDRLWLRWVAWNNPAGMTAAEWNAHDEEQRRRVPRADGSLPSRGSSKTTAALKAKLEQLKRERE